MAIDPLQSAFVLHYRAYRDSSLLVDLLTKLDGRLTVVARGAKRPKSNWKGLLQPFVSLDVRYQGKGELKTLVQAEPGGECLSLQGMTLWCGLYLNELLMKSLHQHDACPGIFALYYHSLLHLHQGENEQILLRQFEKRLLYELGYDLHLDREPDSGEQVLAERYYHYLPEHGVSAVSAPQQGSVSVFSGKSLLAIHQGQWQNEQTLRDAKRLFRLALSPLLSRPLNSPQILAGRKLS